MAVNGAGLGRSVRGEMPSARRKDADQISRSESIKGESQ